LRSSAFAVADQVPDRLRIDFGAAEPGQHVIERRRQIGRGVGERAVEIERDDVEGEVGHPRRLSPAAMEMARFPCDWAP
jgi:hypothetical protein